MANIKEAPERFGIPLEGEVPFEPLVEIHRLNPEKMWRIAEQMVGFSLEVEEGDRLLIEYEPGSRQLVEMIGYIAASRGAAVLPRCSDPSVEAAILAGVEQHPTSRIHEEMIGPQYADIGWATKVAIARCKDAPEAMDIVDGDIASESAKAKEARLWTRVSRRPWCLIYIPTPAEAGLDEMDYGNYVDVFLNACDRPWEEVEKAQDILIATLSEGKVLEFFADEDNPDERWRTRLTMNIDGMTFANSTIRKNFPGSEVFSAPVRETITGRFALPYKVMFGDKMLPNLVLEFEEGRVVKHYTDGDMEWVQRVLDTDEGAREVGEVAFGTNPAFKRPFLNGLYVEKVGGSFHLAIGSAYPFTEYAGRPVRVDNEVRSANHEDLTRMMLPKFGGGRVLLDGKEIQRDGAFLDPRLEILNPLQD